MISIQPWFPYKWFIFFFSFTVIFIQPCTAQYEEKDFVRYTVKEGLSDNYITCIQQDDRGYVWAGTNTGLNRFDGHSFKNFYQGTADLPLASSDIRNIKKFGPDQLGIISGGGLELLNTANFSLKRFHIPDSTSFNTYLNAAWDAIMLTDGSFAITTDAGFYVFNKSGKIDFRHDKYDLEDVGKKRIHYGRDIFQLNNKDHLVYFEASSMAYYDAEKKSFTEPGIPEKGWNTFSHPDESQGGHWVTKYQVNNDAFIFIFYTKDSIVYYNHKLQKRYTSSLPFKSSSVFGWESRIAKMNDSTFVINDRARGFYLFNVNRQTGEILFNKKKFLPSHKIIRLFVDRDNRLWVATSEGLLQQKLNPSYISSYRFQPSPGDTLTGGFNCAYRYKDKLYAGRFSLYKGLVILDPASMQLKKEISFYGNNIRWNEILSIEMYYPDTLWIGTNAGLLWFDTKTDDYGKVFDEKMYTWAPELSAILAPPRKDGYAWMCSYLGGMVIRYHIPSRRVTVFTSGTQPALPFEKVKNIAYDSYGDVWIGGHSLTRWNNNKQLFDTLITVYGGANKFNDNILALSSDDNGSLWLHNAFNGLLEFRIREKRWVAYSMKDGLPSDALQSLSPVIENSLWIGSNSQLARFDTRTKKIVVYDHQDGLPEHKPTGRLIWFDKINNHYYMGAYEYIVKFPAHQYNNYENSSELIVYELTVNNTNSYFQPGNKIQLKYNENNLSLYYTIIDFEKSKYQFAYKLNNAGDWIMLGQQRSINLNNLQPGKYNILLKATGKSGDEKLKEFTLTILPPFWKTTWFLTACVVIFSGTLFYLYRRRISQVRQKANIDRLLAQTEMKALHSQMNPHFIFNSLNSIREMILNNENKEASHYLSKFAQLIRVTLDQSGQSFITLRNTLDYLNRYIEMEKIRNSHFTCSISVDKELDIDETVLPPMLIQPFIENAIWHGVTANRKDIDIRIYFSKSAGADGRDNQLVCVIDDNGIGIERSMANSNHGTGNGGQLHNPVGISNIKQRIHLLNEKHNLRSSVTIVDKSDINGSIETGTLVTLHLPLEINEE